MLCIGGPLAGQRKEILYGRKFIAFQEPDLPPLYWRDYYSPHDTVEFKQIIYTLQSINTPEGEVTFWIPEQQTMLETLTLLFETYMKATEHHGY